MVACFAPDFRSEQPFHPERSFTGQAGVRKNWTFFFTTVPDIQVEILNEATEGTPYGPSCTFMECRPMESGTRPGE